MSRPFIVAVVSLIAAQGCRTPEPPTPPAEQGMAYGDSAMVVSAAPRATDAGLAVLQHGGNAIDAAVAVAFALEVAYPTAGNIGGGGFLVARVNGQSVALDFRETAPSAATRDMYVNARGEVTDSSVESALAAGVPGSVAGLWEAHQRFGSRPWAELLQPAIDLAEQGFPVDAAFIEDMAYDAARLAKHSGSASQYLPNGAPPKLGSTWRSPDLVATLKRIATQGRDGFYTGLTAEFMVAEMKRSGGIISFKDLAGYQAKWRDPVELDYRGQHIISMPPPSSGGLTLGLILRILEGYDLGRMGWRSAQAIHLTAEAEKVAFARRNTLLADPDFVPLKSDVFRSPDSAAAFRAAIGGTASAPAGGNPTPEPRHTTHFSIVDAKGNAVALTTTLNTSYGSAVTVSGAGFLLNNEMDDFTAKVGARNAMGLVQGDANAIAPGKRMLSSMTPTIVLDSAGAPVVVTGAAGGAFIITGVTHVLLSVLDFHRPLGEAMRVPQFHQQDVPDSIIVEPGPWADSLRRLVQPLGHAVSPTPTSWNALAFVQSIMRVGGRWAGVSEPRGSGLARGY